VIRIALDNYLPSSDTQSYCGQYTSGSYGNNLVEHAMADICNPVFTGAQTTTDDDGVAYFDNFMILSGAPGLYSFNFSCASATCLQNTDSLSRTYTTCSTGSLDRSLINVVRSTHRGGEYCCD
jgi:ribosomal protein L31